VVYNGVTLEDHHVDIEIDGLTGDETACKARKAIWNGAACVLENVPAKTAIKLPKSTTAFQVMDEFNRVPTLAGQCPGSTVDPAIFKNYAAILTPTSGKLDRCTYTSNGGLVNTGLVTYLVLDNASGALVVNGTAFPLNDNARVYISNSPEHPHTGPPNPEAHFFWFYRILVPPPGGCSAVPRVVFVGPACTRFAPTHRHSFDAFSGGTFCGPVK